MFKGLFQSVYLQDFGLFVWILANWDSIVDFGFGFAHIITRPPEVKTQPFVDESTASCRAFARVVSNPQAGTPQVDLRICTR